LAAEDAEDAEVLLFENEAHDDAFTSRQLARPVGIRP
jgi:hypothetical protein